jgi:hypothetical protein
VRRRREVRVSDPQADDVHPLLDLLLLHPVQLANR